MLIGVPKEIKSDEYRVGLTPASVRECIVHGHRVIIEKDAAAGIGYMDKDYEDAGAVIVDSAKEIFATADLVVKVKEPQPEECKQFRAGQMLFTYLHLAPDVQQTNLLLESQVSAIAYETITDPSGELPLLTPMSQVAGRLSIQAGACALEKRHGGSGILLGGVPGVAPANVVVIGGGIVGTNAVRMALGLEAHVTVLDRSLKRLKELDFQFRSKVNTIYATRDAIEYYVSQADLVIGAVLIPGAAAPRLVTRKMLKEMRPGSVLVDVAIDQGGCFETSRPTTHANPTFIVDDIVHYCVANMPAAVPRTAAHALNNATLPFVLELANKSLMSALRDNPHLMNGLNIHHGHLTHPAVAQAQQRQFVEPEKVLQM